MQRNLICHLYASPQNPAWKRAVDHILARLPLWDGKRVVAIAIDHDLKVKQYEALREEATQLLDADIERIFVRNDPQLGEMASFPQLLGSVSREPGITFYCHGKGARHPPGSVVHGWADCMWHLCCDYPAVLDETLENCMVAGSFLRKGKRMAVDWHYSGSFYWFRNGFLFNRTYRQFSDPLNRNDTERWPARFCRISEFSGSLGLEDPRNLYDQINWRSWITMRFRREVLWNAALKEDRAKAITKWGELPETRFEPLNEIYQERLKHERQTIAPAC